MGERDLDILYNHYLAISRLSWKTQKILDRTALFLIIAMTVMLYHIYVENVLAAIVAFLFKKNFDSEYHLAGNVSDCILWIVLFSLLVKYVRTSTEILRLQIYNSNLREMLAGQFPPPAFRFEHNFLIHNKGNLNGWLNIVYQIVLPYAVVLLGANKLFMDLQHDNHPLVILFEAAFLAGIAVTAVLFTTNMAHIKKSSS